MKKIKCMKSIYILGIILAFLIIYMLNNYFDMEHTECRKVMFIGNDASVNLAQYDNVFIPGVQVVNTIKTIDDETDSKIRFLIDNGVTVTEYNGYDRRLIDKNSLDYYINPVDRYLSEVTYDSEGDIDVITFSVQTVRLS